MFAKTTNVGFAQRVVATLVASAIMLWSLGAYISTAQAATLSDVEDTLSTSNPGVMSSHAIQFTLVSDLDIGDTITITFPTGAGEFDGAEVAAVASGDITATVNGSAVDESGGFVSTDGGAQSTIVFETDVAGVAGQVVTVAIADTELTNPTLTTSHEIVVTLGNTAGDIGKTRVAIVDSVLVTAVVETTFDFVIEGTATNTPMAIGTATTTGSSTPTTLDYGVLQADVPELLSQRLNVTTNADKGFVVTVQSDGDFASANGAVIDNFVDGSDQATTGQAWVSPSRDIDDETTWGHWGLKTDDNDLNSLGGYYTEDFGTSQSFIAASTTPRVIFHHDGPADGSTQDKGEAIVLYQVEITPFQEAADDYNTTLTYIATPTF